VKPTPSSTETAPALPDGFLRACDRRGAALPPHILTVNAATQRLAHFQSDDPGSDSGRPPESFALIREYLVSTSRVGLGQQEDSHRTPLGLHRISDKIGAGAPKGTVFRGRQPVGLVQEGHPDAPIAHRILWLDGLEPGFNRGGDVDTHNRYIYIHGLGDESRLGKPDSIGCVHMAADDLIPLFDILPVDTLVWIAEE